MKLWQQVKNIFQNDTPITLEGVGLWLEQHYAAILADAEFQQGMQRYLDEIQKQRDFLAEQVDQWDLDSIADRKQLQSLRFLRTSVQETVSSIYFTQNNQKAMASLPTLPELLRFHTIFSKRVEQLLQHLEKNYPSLPFPLVEHLTSLHIHNSDFRDLIQKSAVLKLDLVQQHYLQLHACRERYSQLLLEIQHKRERLEQAQHKLQEKEANVAKLKAAPHYQEVQQQEQKRKELSALRNELTDTVYTTFTVLAPALKSYQRFHPHDVVERYIHDSVGALGKDDQLEIIPILQDIERKIHQQELSITLDQATAAIPVLERVTGGLLPMLRQKLALVREELNGYANLQGKDFLLKIEEAAYRVEHFRLQGERLAEEISVGEEKLAQLQQQELEEKQELQRHFYAFSGKELRVN